jgi:hypothetical protein
VRQWHPNVTLQTLEKEVDALEEVNERFIARHHISHSL